MLVFVVIFVQLIGVCDCLFIIGCPMYGCRPSGTFSMYLNVPKNNATIAWETKFAYDPVPLALGCVANDVNIICQSNGPFDEDKGYICLDGWNGTVRWRDKVLRFPALPLMDNYGDVTGSDGNSLVHYDQNGKLYPVISVKGMKPLFSIAIVSTHFMLLVSENGGLFVRELNAIPDASIFLNATVHGINGTFIPISQPVVNNSRFYLLTEFVPYDSKKIIHVQRVYALDIHNRMADIVTVAWYYEFDMQANHGYNKRLDKHLEASGSIPIQPLIYRNHSSHRARKIPDLEDVQNLMWDGTRNLLYIILPPIYEQTKLRTESKCTFYALKDLENEASLVYRFVSSPVSHMTMFEKNSYPDRQTTRNANHLVNKTDENHMWISLKDGKLLSLSANGSVFKIINLPALLESTVEITSKLMTARKNDTSADILVMGVKFSNKWPNFNLVLRRHGIHLPKENITSALIAVDTSITSTHDAVLWVVPIPSGMIIKGQISGSLGASTRRKDRLILYAEEGGKLAKVFAVE